jgi:hypothetical protein
MQGAREVIALRLGVILVEAFRSARNVDVEIFSHTGDGRICEIRRLGSKSNAAHRLGGYRAENRANYDDLALRAVTSLLERRPAEQRILFVLSDALPLLCSVSGSKFDSGVEATAKVVAGLRSRGWRVIGLTVGSGHGARIYGADRVHISDVSETGSLFAKLLINLFQTGPNRFHQV